MVVEKMIQIPLSDFIQLMNAESELRLLEGGGVDNWEWYGESLSPYEDCCEQNKETAETMWRAQNGQN